MEQELYWIMKLHHFISHNGVHRALINYQLIYHKKGLAILVNPNSFFELLCRLITMHVSIFISFWNIQKSNNLASTKCHFIIDIKDRRNGGWNRFVSLLLTISNSIEFCVLYRPIYNPCHAKWSGASLIFQSFECGNEKDFAMINFVRIRCLVD